MLFAIGLNWLTVIVQNWLEVVVVVVTASVSVADVVTILLEGELDCEVSSGVCDGGALVVVCTGTVLVVVLSGTEKVDESDDEGAVVSGRVVPAMSQLSHRKQSISFHIKDHGTFSSTPSTPSFS